MHGTHRVLLVIPSGRKVRSAYLEDVDTAGVQTKRLSQWVLIVGVLLMLGGFLSLIASGQDENDFSSDSETEDAGPVFLVVGGIAAALWIFVKREQVVFSVAGTDHFEFDVFKGGGVDRAAQFLNAYYGLRPEFKRRT
jgi:hypothetical protein